MYLLYNKSDKTIKQVDKKLVMDEIYFDRASLPTCKQISNYIGDDNIAKFLKSDKPEVIQNKIRDSISRISYKIPLYDEVMKNMFLVHREDVYRRVVYDYYRFPEEALLERLRQKYDMAIKNPTMKIYSYASDIRLDKDMYTILQALRDDRTQLGGNNRQDELHKRDIRKLGLILDFCNQYNMEILKETYVKVFYHYSNETGRNITVCLRPSYLPFLKHLKPYYTLKELIKMGLNMGFIKESDINNKSKVELLCNDVSKNDISAKIILKHHKHIIENNKIGIMQYYTLQGSFFLNQYFINHDENRLKNKILEEKAFSIWNLINTAPPFDKPYTLYRFIPDDYYIKNIEIGEMYIVPTFLSTTRDPFYKQTEYQFGFVLIKINIPAHKEGVALCIETVSNFPNEQEIILSPESVLRLDNKDENVPYYHTDDKYELQMKTRYEFTYVGKKSIVFRNSRSVKHENPLVDFMDVKLCGKSTVRDNLNTFLDTYADELYHFRVNIGKRTFTLISEYFDSTGAYRNFYASNTTDGFMFYTFIGDYIGFTLEMGEDSSGKYMYVNYYYRHSTVPKENNIDDVDLTEFLAKVAYCFFIDIVIIYATYRACAFQQFKTSDNKRAYYNGGIYCEDFYEYLSLGNKKYVSNSISPGFDYTQLDKLKTTDPLTVLRKVDRDELYQLYVKQYTVSYPTKLNIADFYIWLIHNNCKYTIDFTKKLSRMFKTNNPFVTDHYVMNVNDFMLEKNYITADDLKDRKTRPRLPNIKNEYRIIHDKTKPRY